MKNALPGSKYCFSHSDKMSTLRNVIIGAVISLFLSVLWYRLVPSEELKVLRDSAQKAAVETSERKETDEKANIRDQELSEQFNQFQTQLEPFINLAKERYPNIELSEALSNLKNDIKNNREIASRDIFKYPNELIKNNTVYALKQWKEKYPNLLIKIKLLNANTLHTEQVLYILCGFLISCDIKIECIRASSIKIGKEVPITIYTSPEFQNAAVLLLDALGNYIGGEKYYDEKTENKFIEINLNGIPNFYSNGNVILE